MKFSPFLVLLAILFLNTDFIIAQNTSAKLTDIITGVQDHKGYDKEEFPLGLFRKKFYRRESVFALETLKELETIQKKELSQTEQISLELLKFKLQETVDFYKYEAYLNPLLSDAGFHLSLPYQVRDLANYDQVKSYLNKLNAIPVYVDQHLALLREGIEKGITQPKVIFKGYVSSFTRLLMEVD